MLRELVNLCYNINKLVSAPSEKNPQNRKFFIDFLCPAAVDIRPALDYK
jgi:prephenate dehydratase